MRILVLWNACTGISREEDARWVSKQAERLRGSDGVADARLHTVESAGPLHVRQWDWCLELDVNGSPSSVVRSPRCAELLADLRLLGTRPAVLVLPGGLQ